jgi:hypothetical protein
MVFFACEQIPALGAYAASENLLHKTSEKAADAHTIADCPHGGFFFAASSPWRILPRSHKSSCRLSHSRDPLTGKENHSETRIFTIYERKQIFKKINK